MKRTEIDASSENKNSTEDINVDADNPAADPSAPSTEDDPGDEKKDELGSKKNSIPHFLRNNLLTKLLSVFFALLLWVYAISVMDPPPTRTKSVEVQLFFINEDKLNEESNLVIASDRKNIPQNVTVYVNAKVKELGYVTPSTVSAYVDLSDIQSAGENQSLRVRTSLEYGNEVDVSPWSIELDIDKRETLQLPIDVQYEGELSEGYWRGSPVLTPEEITLVGPKSDIDSLRSAVCKVSLSGRTASINEAFPIELINSDGEIIDDATLIDLTSSVALQMDIYPKKTVPLDTESVVQGNVEPGYEQGSISFSPGEVEIAGPQDVLDRIEKLHVNMINIDGATQSVTANCVIQVPADLAWCNYSSTSVNVNISEKTSKILYDNFTLKVSGLGRDLKSSLMQESVNIELSGPLSQIKALSRQDLEAYVDVSSREAGVATLPVEVTLPDYAGDLTAKCVPSSVTVIISEK